ncbi:MULTISPECIES: hypothetical protein [Streptomyces]|uniref:Uncharacterized protein n=1 Tax=Streptomyces salyersiae TaxID=3075530 RepID=A0ABU2RYH7_9ACTN|nr:hypothetical protein [Streptomyces sp. DSM 41770]MDT0432643.1 hypothetical protein [Streptomyces sp. DSM 41770]
MGRTQPKCGAPTRKGTRCARLAMVGASRCDRHRGDWSRYTVRRRKEKERMARRRRGQG